MKILYWTFAALTLLSFIAIIIGLIGMIWAPDCTFALTTCSSTAFGNWGALSATGLLLFIVFGICTYIASAIIYNR